MWELVAERNHSSPQRSGEPFCTTSELVYYFEGDGKVAEVHRYLRPDGTIGGSGRPDPKALLRAGVLYVLSGRARGPT